MTGLYRSRGMCLGVSVDNVGKNMRKVAHVSCWVMFHRMGDIDKNCGPTKYCDSSTNRNLTMPGKLKAVF